MSAQTGIRIEHNGFVGGHHTKVVYVAADGTETDISNHVREIDDIRFKPGELVTARVRLLVSDVTASAEISHLLVDHFPPQSGIRGRLRRFPKKLRDVTALGSQWRTWA